MPASTPRPRLRVACLAPLLVVLASLAATTTAIAADPVVELNGWKLWQFRSAMEAQYGPPRTVVEGDGLTSRVYFIDDAAYMVASIRDQAPNHIATLQLTGYTAKALPFLGLTLGASEADVHAALGAPTTSSRVEDWPVVLHAYEGRNYSVETDADGRLYSIRITAEPALTANAVAGDCGGPGQDVLRRFADALATGHVARILDELRPDVEIFVGGRTLSINRRFADFASRPDPDFLAALVGAHGVAAALAGTEPAAWIRLTEGGSVGCVYDFPRTSPLAQIVFFPYAGALRVYEIAFREPATEAGPRRLGQADPARTAEPGRASAGGIGARAALR